MPFESVLVTGGVVGASLLLGVMAQTLWISNEVRAVAALRRRFRRADALGQSRIRRWW